MRRVRQKKKKEDDLISYRSGNDLIIQPTKFKDTSGFATIVSILLGVAIGVAVTCFLIVPSIRQSAKSEANKSVLQANDTIATKNQEIANLENEIDDLAQQIADAQTITQQDADKVSSYEQLVIAHQAFVANDITTAGDALSKVNAEHLSETVKPIYDSINASVNAQYLQTTYGAGYAAYNAEITRKLLQILKR